MMEKKSKKNVPKKNSEKKMLEKKYSKTNVQKKSFNKNILVSEILTSVAVNKLTCLSLFIHSFILVSLLHSSCLILSSYSWRLLKKESVLWRKSFWSIIESIGIILLLKQGRIIFFPPSLREPIPSMPSFNNSNKVSNYPFAPVTSTSLL